MDPIRDREPDRRIGLGSPSASQLLVELAEGLDLTLPETVSLLSKGVGMATSSPVPFRRFCQDKGDLYDSTEYLVMATLRRWKMSLAKLGRAIVVALLMQAILAFGGNEVVAESDFSPAACEVPLSPSDSPSDTRAPFTELLDCIPSSHSTGSARVCTPDANGYYRYCAYARVFSQRQPGYPECPYDPSWGGDVCMDQISFLSYGSSLAAEPWGGAWSRYGWVGDGQGNWLHWDRQCSFTQSTAFRQCDTIDFTTGPRPCSYGNVNADMVTAAGDFFISSALIWAITPIVESTCT